MLTRVDASAIEAIRGGVDTFMQVGPVLTLLSIIDRLAAENTNLARAPLEYEETSPDGPAVVVWTTADFRDRGSLPDAETEVLVYDFEGPFLAAYDEASGAWDPGDGTAIPICGTQWTAVPMAVGE